VIGFDPDFAALGQRQSGAEDLIADKEAFVLAYAGRLRQARMMSRRATDLAHQAAQRERAALREAFFGNAPAARRSAMGQSGGKAAQGSHPDPGNGSALRHVRYAVPGSPGFA
jgi:hypothetical protein